ncbi:hypothetical protein K488DRAFT_72283 [Vararia minispora EC-137]|uniref:Uncharacterized protein n=1 Tax=Vararia minispora EC-137 TaxID=1314806 RepID=A0ACB8QES7_9AGAM|nr:hypothetical protein K488DRAFT_72283 [Vararia minispora EC-137]
MAWTNSHRAPELVDFAGYADYGPDPYDINFCCSLDLSALESERVKLTPFIPREHAPIYFDQLTQHVALSEYYSAAPPSSLGELLYTLEFGYRQNPHHTAFAILDKGRPSTTHPDWSGSLAGFVALKDAAPEDLSVELGSLRVFPDFQRTYVTSNAVGLLLRFCLERPPAGLGMRRVAWGATAGHAASVNAALRMGFKAEGVTRWHKVVYNTSKKGAAPREGDPLPENPRSDSAVFSLCADDWEEGGRELVQRMIVRK